MASSSTEKKMIVLISKEGEKFEVEEAAALLSKKVKNLIGNDSAAAGIPLPDVDSRILAKVIEFCNRHAAAERFFEEEDLKTFDSDYIMSVKDDLKMLFGLVLAANNLGIKILEDLMCQAIADMIRGKTPEEIRKTFLIINNFTPEAEAEFIRENAWAFE